MAIFDNKMAVGKSENLVTLHPHDLTQPFLRGCSDLDFPHFVRFNCFYSDMENKTICGPAFHVCAPYRCKNKSLRDICVYSDMEHKMTGVWNLIKNISCGVSSKVKRHEF